MMQNPEDTAIPGENTASGHARATEILSAIGHAASLWNALYCEALASQLGVSAAEQKCLDLVLDNRGRPDSSPMTPRQVARAINLTPGAVTGVLSRLEAAGYITRTHDQRDRRRVLIILNDDRIDEDIGPLRRQWDAAVQQLCSHYSEPDLRLVGGFMQGWTAMLQECTETLRGPTGLSLGEARHSG